MAPPIYFFPRATRRDLVDGDQLRTAFLEGHGLLETFADVRSVSSGCWLQETPAPGPGGSSGSYLSALPISGDAPPRIGYHPDQQRWVDFGPFWAGVDREYPPTPACLVRSGATPSGYRLEIDGQQWIVPIIRDPQGNSGLPRDYRYQRTAGQWQLESVLQDAYRAVWDAHAWALEYFFGAASFDQNPTSDQEKIDTCLRTLGLVYRVGPVEQTLLGLVRPDNWETILAWSVNLPVFRELFETRAGQKKSAAENCLLDSPDRAESSPPPTCTSPGSEDSGPTTDRPAPNSAPSRSDSATSRP